MSKKARLDNLLVERNLASSREKAKALILSGQVLVNNVPVDKAGSQVNSESDITLKTEEIPYVSRGGIKLEGALEHFGVDATGKVGIDVGASTGGFTDCLLQKGAKHVYAVDVGYGQFAWKLRGDKRVTLIERKNVRFMEPADIGGVKVDIIVIDVSFISLRHILPPIKPLLKEGGEIVSLIKPQFEVGKGEVGKGGLVSDPLKRAQVVEEISTFAQGLGYKVLGTTTSQITGSKKGNVEFFIYLSL
ncbi:MAG: TlyA family RNA methyltransferase [Nitrospinota bacterium]|nr:TlyA family RNA methyltransferase [Nitrospinota bacterium]